jgi:spore maturation protein CgeB
MAPHLMPFCSTEPVYGLKKTKIYNACKIVIHVEDEEKNVNSLNCRVPEVLACGGFVLTQWTRDLDTSGLRDGETVASFQSHSELVEKVEYYLSHPEERQLISEKGRRYVLENLTYDASYGGILDQVEASF